MSAGRAVLGLDWGMPPERVAAHLGAGAMHQDSETMTASLDTVAARLAATGLFCPSILAPGWAEDSAALAFAFQGGGLAAAQVRVHYPFRQLGQRSDALSDSAMTLLTRGEFNRVMAELVARYGAPTHISEHPSRIGAMHVSASALFLAEDGGPVQLFYGHESAGVSAEMRWMAPAAAGGGF